MLPLPLTTLIIFLSSLVGLGTGQSAKIILTYPPLVQVSLPGPPSTCKVGVEFFDGNSNLVNAQTVSLVPGQSAQMTFTRSQLGGPPSAIHPLFWVKAGLIDTCNGDPNCDLTQCNVSAIGEQADTSGSTDLLMDNLRRLFDFNLPIKE